MTDQNAETKATELPADPFEGKLFTQEEIAKAAEELKTLTPEAYAEMIHYIALLESSVQKNITTHGAAAHLDLYSPNGANIRVDCYGATPYAAVKESIHSVRLLHQEFGITGIRHTPGPVAPVSQSPALVHPETPSATNVSVAPPAQVITTTVTPEPQYVPIGVTTPPQTPSTGAPAPHTEKVYRVDQIAHKKTTGGVQSFLAVKVGRWAKFGAPAYEEVIPADIFAALQGWPTETWYNLFDERLAYAVVDESSGKPRVIQFMKTATG